MLVFSDMLSKVSAAWDFGAKSTVQTRAKTLSVLLGV